MKKTIKLKESDIINIVKRIIKEDSHYGMNKGDKSKTHKGRDYEGDDKQMIIDVLCDGDMKRCTVKRMMNNYIDMYNRADDEWKRDLPSIEEVKSVAMKAIEDNDGDDGPKPVAMILFWFLGIGIALAWRRWGPGGYGDWPW